MAINNEPTIQPIMVTGIFTKYIAKTLPLAFDESMSYYECLCALLDYINKTIVPDINNANEGLTELQNFYLELQSYVNNYFENLDVQEEINNKLDDMVEQGVLDQIIEQYLQSSALWVFDNVADMKDATNLINGSYAKTLGYYSKNDGGMSTYKVRTITNDDIVDEKSIIALSDDTLIAELINEDSINPEQFGCYGDNTHDDTTNLQALFTYAYNKKLKVILDKKYKITENININKGVNISGNTLNAGIYGSNNNIYIKGGSSTGTYANNSDVMLIDGIYLYQTTFVLGDTTTDYGSGVNFSNCVFYGNSQNTSAIIVKNNSWIFTINNCKIGNFTNGIYFKFKNDDNSYVINSGAAIKITNTDVFNCGYGVYVKGAAADGYNILISDCDLEHNDYSIYTEDGRGNNIQCNNLHIEGNRYGSIYADATYVYVNNIWDFNSNPDTYVALYNVVNNGKIVINSGRIAYTNYKLANIVSGNVYLNTNQIVITPFIQSYQVLTSTSTKSLLLPSNYQYYVPASISGKTYNSSSNEVTLTTVPKQANHGIRITLDLRQTNAISDANDKRLAVFVNAGSPHGIACAIHKNNEYIRLVIEYTSGKLMCKCTEKIDNGDTYETLYYAAFNDDGINVNKYILMNYNAENGQVATVGSKFEYISDFLVK